MEKIVLTIRLYQNNDMYVDIILALSRKFMDGKHSLRIETINVVESLLNRKVLNVIRQEYNEQYFPNEIYISKGFPVTKALSEAEITAVVTESRTPCYVVKVEKFDFMFGYKINIKKYEYVSDTLPVRHISEALSFPADLDDPYDISARSDYVHQAQLIKE